MSTIPKLRDLHATRRARGEGKVAEHQVAKTVTLTIDVDKLFKASRAGGDFFKMVAEAMRRAADDCEAENYEYPIFLGESWVGWFETEFRKEEKKR